MTEEPIEPAQNNDPASPSVSQKQPGKLDLGKLETLRRWSQYGALLVLIVFIGLIGLSSFELRRIWRATADARVIREEVNAEIVKLNQEAERLRKENKALETKNGTLASANKTLTDVTNSVSNESSEQAEKVKEAFEISIATTKDPNQLPPRIYIHIGDESQRDKAKSAAGSLQQKGYLVPGIENVGPDRAPKLSQLRYYQDDSFGPGDSKDIVSTLEDRGINVAPKDSLNGSGRSHRPRHYEIWFGKDF
jgi:cell division protein FtsB